MAPRPALNADFRPMSYFPLSLLRWEDAVHDVFNDRVSILPISRSPSTKMRLLSVVAMRKYQPTVRRVAFTRFKVSCATGSPDNTAARRLRYRHGFDSCRPHHRPFPWEANLVNAPH